jgi:predicted aspartyl protease
MQRPECRICLLLLGLLSLSATAIAADAPVASSTPPAPACNLERFASLDLTTQSDGRVTAPVKINGQMLAFIVDTGGMYGGLSSSIANSMGLNRKPFPFGEKFIFWGRSAENEYVTGLELQIGEMRNQGFEIPIMSDRMLSDSEDGLLGPSVLSLFDVEIDYVNEKLNLFSPDHCPGNVVYWTTANYARVPIEVDQTWHITVPVMLDGKEIKAVVDTGAHETVMTVERARSIFDWQENDPSLKKLSNGQYTYPFQSLTFEGIQVDHPDIRLENKASVAPGMPEMLLGSTVLRQLHLYIAYKEKALYLSPAEAK